MPFVAYTYKGGKKVSGVHDTREAAAAELFGKFPKLESVETANAVGAGQIGGDARPIYRSGHDKVLKPMGRSRFI